MLDRRDFCWSLTPVLDAKTVKSLLCLSLINVSASHRIFKISMISWSSAQADVTTQTEFLCGNEWYHKTNYCVKWSYSTNACFLLCWLGGHFKNTFELLTHWGRVTHICIDKLAIIGSDNGLSPDRRQPIIWINAGILLIGPLGTNFSEILIEIQTFSLKKIRLKMSSTKCCSFRLGLNVLNLRALKFSSMNKIYIFQCMGKIFLWNSAQNIFPIHWKIWFLYNTEILKALRFKSSYAFLKRSPGHRCCILRSLVTFCTWNMERTFSHPSLIFLTHSGPEHRQHGQAYPHDTIPKLHVSIRLQLHGFPSVPATSRPQHVWTGLRHWRRVDLPHQRLPRDRPYPLQSYLWISSYHLLPV